jgi:hypothetical protein
VRKTGGQPTSSQPLLFSPVSKISSFPPISFATATPFAPRPASGPIRLLPSSEMAQSARPSSVPTHAGSGEKVAHSKHPAAPLAIRYWTGIGQSWGQAPGILLHPFRVLTPGILVDLLSTSLVGVRNLALACSALSYSILSFPSPGPNSHAILKAACVTLDFALSSRGWPLSFLLLQFPNLRLIFSSFRSLPGFGSARHNLRVQFLIPRTGPTQDRPTHSFYSTSQPQLNRHRDSQPRARHFPNTNHTSRTGVRALAGAFRGTVQHHGVTADLGPFTGYRLDLVQKLSLEARLFIFGTNPWSQLVEYGGSRPLQPAADLDHRLSLVCGLIPNIAHGASRFATLQSAAVPLVDDIATNGASMQESACVTRTRPRARVAAWRLHCLLHEFKDKPKTRTATVLHAASHPPDTNALSFPLGESGLDSQPSPSGPHEIATSSIQAPEFLSVSP